MVFFSTYHQAAKIGVEIHRLQVRFALFLDDGGVKDREGWGL